jgi:hypothetical protein
MVEGRPAAQDVKATRLVHEFGNTHGCVFYYSKKSQRREKVPVAW